MSAPAGGGRAARVSIVGSGNVGANTAFFIAEKGVTDVLLVDVVPGLSRGKALDIMEAAPVRRYRNRLSGFDDIEAIAGSQVVVLAAGAIRKPGMRREDLFEANAPLAQTLASRIAAIAPESIVVIATEPVDPVTALFTRESGMPRTRVIGLGTILDSTRMRALVARELGLSMEIVSAMVLGRHSDDMICLPRYTTVSGVPVANLLSAERISSIVVETRRAGDLVVDLARKSSAYYAPSAAIAELVDSIHMNLMRVFPVSVALEGEYGAREGALSVAAVIGGEGVSRVLEPELTEEERSTFLESARKVAAIMNRAASRPPAVSAAPGRPSAGGAG